MFGISNITIFGNEIHLWTFVNVIGYTAFVIYVFICVRMMQNGNFLCPYLKHSLNKKAHSIVRKLSIIEAVIIALVAVFSEYSMNLFFGRCFGPVTYNYFGNVLFAPLLIMLICYVLKIKPITFMDKIIPAFAIQYCISNVANYFAGCCAGKYWENGIYNLADAEKQYPTPLYALAFAILIFFIVVIISKKSKRTGMAYPLFVFLYSITRLVTQFFRVDNLGTICSLPVYSFQCIICALIGVVFCIIAFIYAAKIENKLLEHHFTDKI